MLGDRSYLDGNYTVFGDVVEGMDVVMRIVQRDVVESVRIERVGAKARLFRPTTESFRAQLKEAERRVAERVEKKRAAEAEWIAANMQRVADPAIRDTAVASGPLRVRYSGRQLHYVDTGWDARVRRSRSSDSGVKRQGRRAS
jgi:hypothetical protein